MSSEDTPANSLSNPELIATRKEQGELLRAKLLGETARAPWKELQRFFAQGLTLQAQPGVDLLAVAMALAEDDRPGFEAFMNAGEAGVVSDEQAAIWYNNDATLWTVVVKPWVLVQEILAAEEKENEKENDQ